jgi:hypothetical protein
VVTSSRSFLGYIAYANEAWAEERAPPAPNQIDGPVLISDDELEGVDLPFGQANPYAQFKQLKPSAVLDGGVLVYDGHFDVPLASSLVEMANRNRKRRRGRTHSNEKMEEDGLRGELSEVGVAGEEAVQDAE